ncbi:transporter substrate-binding domain-containing protein [Stenotrophomonas sp. YAU14A_MKIMI4_1]|uniref:ATP-binding protein n=1 Tax=Stenotrophomonas sp. YAU14A_MKIMI4_1 TaxID=2072408 RepID=UPI00131F257E|nr:transporter substrate-binding domain-containing protein [Stenotrophomonas sp. YAU14A_MKIMI4_1]
MASLPSDQRAYLARNPVIVAGIVGGWPPFEVVDGQAATGLSPELLTDLASRLGVQVKFKTFDNFADVLRSACQGSIDVVMNASLSAERTRCLVYTGPYAEAPIGLIAHPSDPQLRDDPDLVGVRLVSNSGTATERLAKERYPRAIHIAVTSPAEAMRMVSDRRADAYLGDSQVATRILLDEGFHDLALIRPSDLPYDLLHYAVPNAKQPLAEALDAALRSLSVAERRAHDKRWLVQLSWFDRGEFAMTASEMTMMKMPLRVGWPSGFTPIAFSDSKGRPVGLASEYLRKLRLAGAQFQLVEPMPWVELQKAIEGRRVDVAFGIPQDSAWLGDDWLLTKPFASVANVIVAGPNGEDIRALADLNGRTVAVSDPRRISRYIRSVAPQAIVVSVPSAAVGMEWVNRDKADAYVGNLAVADALIRAHYAGSLDVVAGAGFQDDLSIAVQRRYAPLVGIFDRILSQMDPGERESLRSKWLAVQYNKGVDWTTLWRWLAPLLGVLITAIIVQAWNQMRLSREVVRRQATEVKLKDARSAAEQAANAKSEFLATMSHEIRTPMSAVMGMVEVLGQSDLSAPQREILTVIDDSASSLRLLLDDILDVSRLEGGGLVLNPSAVDVRGLITGVGALMEPEAKRKGIGWSAAVAPAIGDAYLLDELRLRQVLINLVGNAIKFTASGGVSILVREVGSGKGGHTLRFSVTDTGIGMSEDEQRRVVEPFTQATLATTREYGGSGLGLAIVAGLLKLMGATLRISSAIGRGTEISFELEAPLTQAIPRGERLLQMPTPLATRLRVLVAEDDPANLLLMKYRLQALGLDAVLVEDGAKAMHELQVNGPFDVLITDCQMPAMDGYALAKSIRADESVGAGRLPIVAMTASASAKTQEACTDAGMDHVLLKPFDMDALRGVLVASLSSEVAESTRHEHDVPEPSRSADSDRPSVGSNEAEFAWRDLLRQVGSAGVAKQVVDALGSTFAADVPELRQAMDAGDAEKARRKIHRIAGGLGMTGFGTLAAVGQRLEAECVDLSPNMVASIEGYLEQAGSAVSLLTALAAEASSLGSGS